jgi:phage head maturation protease
MSKKGYKRKNCDFEIKADAKNRMVEGYFSAFDNIDSDDDKILKGAFTKSIKEHGPNSSTNRKIAHLAYHDVTRPIGVIEELNSIGFNYIADKIKQAKEGDQNIWEIQEVKLWEGSAVVFGANSETPNLAIVKSQEDINLFLEDYNQRMEICIKAVMDCNLSQKFNNLFHLELEALKIGYNSLVNFEPFNKNTQQNEEPNAEKEDQIKKQKQEQENKKKLFY